MRRLILVAAFVPFAALAQPVPQPPDPAVQALQSEVLECYSGKINFHGQLIAAQQQIAGLQKQVADLKAGTEKAPQTPKQ